MADKYKISRSNPLVLASGSPRRRQLLEWAELPFEVKVSDVDESFPADMPPTEVPVYLAGKKASAVQSSVSKGRVILAADTIVVVGNEILGKPSGKEEAVEMLRKLSGNTHEVITGVAIVQDEVKTSFSNITAVRFLPLTDAEIVHYVERYGPYDKAGAYAIQEWIGVIGIASISGDFYNVMGLPVSSVVKLIHAEI